MGLCMGGKAGEGGTYGVSVVFAGGEEVACVGCWVGGGGIGYWVGGGGVSYWEGEGGSQGGEEEEHRFEEMHDWFGGLVAR